jgi:hypothetical protein
MDQSAVKMDFSISAWRSPRLYVGAEVQRIPNGCLLQDMQLVSRTRCCE